ncbi:MAG: CapA family protein [Actinomycetia bacterium]|nr:CapA family protein [Actinomycetes bacterium]
MNRWIGLAGLVMALAACGSSPPSIVEETVSATTTTMAPIPAPTTTTTVAPTTTTTPAPRRATLAFTGDIIPHGGVRQSAARAAADDADTSFDFTASFVDVSPVLAAADLAICHLETPIRLDRAPHGYPTFNAPPEMAADLAAVGYDGCSVASNHSMDQAATGVASTLDVLDGAGLVHAGTARTEEEAMTVTHYEAGGLAIAHLSYTYGTNGLPLPADKPWAVNIIEADSILDEAHRARADGAELVIASLHWGAEYRRQPTTFQTELAAVLLPDPDIDLIVGHHAHVVQPIGQIDGEWVVYGLGNFLTNQAPGCCTAASEDGVIVEIDVGDTPEGVKVIDVRAVATWVDRHAGHRIVPVGAALAAAEDGPDPRFSASLARTAEVLGLFGLEIPLR